MRYTRDSMCVPFEIEDDEENIAGKTFNDLNIHDDEQVFIFTADRGVDERKLVNEYLFEDDIYEYVKTLQRSDLLEIIEHVCFEELLKACENSGQAEKRYV